MNFTIRFLEPIDYNRWDEFVSKSGQCSVFALTSYLSALNVNYRLLVVEQGHRILAGIPLTQGLLGAWSTPLFVKFGGVLFDNIDGNVLKIQSRQVEMQDALMSYLSAFHTFDYNFHPTYQNWLPFKWAGYAQTTAYTYRIPPDRAQDWLSQAHTRVRRNAKSARNKGIKVCREDIVDNDVLKILIAPYTQRKLRPPIRFERLAEFSRAVLDLGLGQIWVARLPEGGIACAALIVEDPCAAYLLIHGCASNCPPESNTLLIVNIIDDILVRGKLFDFEGSVIRPIEEFYRAFGGSLTPYSRIWRRGPANNLRLFIHQRARTILGYSR